MPKKQPKAKDEAETVMPDVGYHADFKLRAARSRGYAAGYDGQPAQCPIPGNGPEAQAWNAGYEAARKALS